MTQPQPSIGGTNPSPKGRTVEYAGKMVRGILILLLIFAAAQLIYGIYLAILPPERFAVQLTRQSWFIQPEGDPFSLSSTIPFTLIPGTESVLRSPKAAQLISLFASWLTCLCWGGCFFLMDSIFSQIHGGATPFTEENSRRIRALGLLQIAGSLLPSLLQSVLNWLWAADAFVWQLPLDWILGVLILALSGIFSYGSQLQEEYDQTI